MKKYAAVAMAELVMLTGAAGCISDGEVSGTVGIYEIRTTPLNAP